jgi:hypothetical protein
VRAAGTFRSDGGESALGEDMEEGYQNKIETRKHGRTEWFTSRLADFLETGCI